MQNEQVRETAADEVCASRVLSGQIEVDDPCVHECSSRPWELMSTALDRGPFGNRKVYLATASVIVYQESFRSRTRLSGLSPAGMLGLSIPLRSADQGCYWERAPRRGFIPSMLPGGLDVVMDAKQAHVVVLIALDLLRRSLPEDAISALARSAATHEVPISPVYLEGLTVWLLELLALAQHPPNGLRAEAIAQRVEDELPWRLSCACQAALSFPARVDYSARRLALDRAIGYLRDADLTSVTVAELCRVAGVKQRTLEYGFKTGLGMGPLRFVRMLRLHATRRALAACEPGASTVGDVALRLGFLHQSRFAAEYREHFGELPSQTLARPRQETVAPLVVHKQQEREEIYLG